jgi:hypothetical protein
MNVEQETVVRRSWIRGWQVGRIRRLAVLTAAATGLLALLAEPAQAGITMQHCEPLRRH